jgi:hypothetical protein
MNEIDTPRSDCGTELVERTTPSREAPYETHRRGRVDVAGYPVCGARYCPEEDPSRITRASDDSAEVSR